MRMMRAARRRYGLASRRMAVRTHVAWYWRGLFMVIALGVGIGLAWWIYAVGGNLARSGHEFSGEEREQLHARIRQLESEKMQLQAVQVKIGRHSQIDAEAQKTLEHEIQSLQSENAALKEEIAFVRGMTGSGGEVGLDVQKFTVKNLAAGNYRYHLLLVQVGQKEKNFHGRLQLAVTSEDSSGRHVQLIPNQALADGKFKINLKAYQKMEGEFQVAPGQTVRNVEARIFTDGSNQPKLIKTVSVS